MSAMIFSTDLAQRLDDGVPCRLPPTYVGVRRVRDNNAATMIRRVAAPPAASFLRDGCNRNDNLNDPRTAVGRDNPSEDDSSAMPTTSSPAASSSSTTGAAGMCYTIDGRRMTKAEKREKKRGSKLEARSVRREARARDVEERMRKEKAAKAERIQRRRADEERRRQRVQQCDETTEFKSSHLLRPSAATTELICDIVMNCDDENKDEKEGSSTTHLANASTNIDATSNSSSVRHDYLPAMLTPAATLVAQDLGMLLEPDDYHDGRTTSSTTTNTNTMMTTIMDPILSAKWATALQQSMIPVETTREEEDIRPMAYRLVPEKWSRLCPDTLWMPPPAKTASFKVGKSADSNMTSTSLSSSSSLVQIRNSSSSSTTTTSTTYDDDTYAIVSHLHNHSNIHITCGASFGCDYLLYDGRRTERHSFAGLRVYHCRGGVNNKKKNGTATATTATTHTNGDGGGGNDLELPMPSAYDMTGYVRTMNTARKIALIAMVVPIEDDGQHAGSDDINNDGKKDGVAEEDATMTTPMKSSSSNIRRIAIVDLALEKVLTAHAHVRKGNTAKRRTEEDAASGLAKKRWK